MTDFTAQIKQPTEGGGALAPVYNTCTTADKFAAQGGEWHLHWKNGATPTGTIFVNEQKAVAPPGTTPGVPAGATKWSDLKIATSIGGTSELVQVIADITKYVDSSGFVNIQTVTPTTLTLAIFGPY